MKKARNTRRGNRHQVDLARHKREIQISNALRGVALLARDRDRVEDGIEAVRAQIESGNVDDVEAAEALISKALATLAEVDGQMDAARRDAGLDPVQEAMDMAGLEAR